MLSDETRDSKLVSTGVVLNIHMMMLMMLMMMLVLIDLNAVTRSMDLACKVLSPMVAGLIMKYASLLTSAVVIAAWNVLSLIAEYTVLSHVYRLTPALASKHHHRPRRPRQFTHHTHSVVCMSGRVWWC